ncbi:MAG: 3-dehydroquinate synthase [Bacteroidales bacterium]|nr:3-dehydroquinate synthase [Bacteroidales bacterium]
MSDSIGILNLRTTSSSIDYDIVIDKGALHHIEQYLPTDGKTLIVTDSGVPSQYAEMVASKVEEPYIFTIPSGESSKSIENWSNILSFMTEKRFTRTDRIVSVGGGVVCDLAGFAAATFMRGISFYNIPTTLLSQLDSSIGGKTAVNFGGIKNIAGAFHHPAKVIIDPALLETLDTRNLLNGLVEGIKMAATSDAELFAMIEKSDCLEQIKEQLPEIIYKALKIKKSIVEADPNEKGVRKILNFGHTVGHAIEAAGKGKYLHGEAVGIGMLYFAEGEAQTRIKAILEKLSLPTECNFDNNLLREYIMHDKKAAGELITIIKVAKPGEYEMCKVKIGELMK